VVSLGVTQINALAPLSLSANGADWGVDYV